MLSLLILCSVLVFVRSQEVKPCVPSATVDIGEGTLFSNNSIVHGGIEYLESQWYNDTNTENVTVTRGCICLIKDCLFKCCPEGEAHFGRPCQATQDERVHPFSPQVFSETDLLESVVASEHFLYFYGNPCPDNERYILNPRSDYFYLQQNGVLHQPRAHVSEQRHAAGTFCVDLFLGDPKSANSTSWVPAVLAAVCFGDELDDDFVSAAGAPYGIYAVGLLISVPFLVATLAVYGFVPELRNLHGQCLMAYVAGLLVSYSLLAYLQLHTTSISGSMTGCYVIAFVVFYCFMSSFFWLNVMCFDIWRTFSRYGGKSINPSRERRRFLWYGAYAWGMALLLTAVTALMQFHEGIPDHHIRPNFGSLKCWFADRSGELVYFYGPVFVLVVVNAALFGVTANSIMRIRRETAILKSSESARTDQYDRDRQRYALYLKLFIVMGVNWTLEVLSFFITGADWVWLVADLTNCVLGIFIFIIFVWKNKVRNLLVKRYRRLRYGDSGRTPSSRQSSNWTNRDSHTDDTRVHSDELSHSQPLRALSRPAHAAAAART